MIMPIWRVRNSLRSESGFDVRMLVVEGEVKQLWRGPTSSVFMSLLVSVGVSLSSLIPAA